MSISTQEKLLTSVFSTHSSPNIVAIVTNAVYVDDPYQPVCDGGVVLLGEQMALVPGLNIGVGLLILLLLWVITVLAILALAAVPKARLAIPVVVLLSTIITIVLLFYPRQSAQTPPPPKDVDELFFVRLALLLILSLFLVGGGVAASMHFFEPIHAGSKRTYYVTS